MRPGGSVRLGLFGAFVLALLAAAGACGTSNGSTEGEGGDSGFECPDGDVCNGDGQVAGDDGPAEDGTMCKGSSCIPYDSGPEDSPAFDGPAFDGPEVGPEAGPLPTSVVFVHASRDLPDLRFCWATGKHGPSTTARPFPFSTPAPESNYPAVPVGGAAVLANATELVSQGFDLWAIDAQALAAIEQGRSKPYTCADALGAGDAGVPASQFWELPGNAALSRKTTTVVAITGCARGDHDASAAACGASWSSKGNLAVSELPLPAITTAASGQLPVEATQLSPALAVDLGTGGTASIDFGARDAAALVATVGAAGGIFPSGAWVVLDAGAGVAYGQLGFRVTAPKASLWMSLEESLVLLDPTEDPAIFYGQTTSFLVAVVGDPGEPAGYGPGAIAAPDGTQLHVLVLALPAPQ